MGANQKSLTNKPSRAPRDLGETPAEVPRLPQPQDELDNDAATAPREL